MKIKNKLLLFLTILTIFIPSLSLAYSEKVVLGGENVGIEIQTDGVIVVGFYNVNNKKINQNNNIALGDVITSVNDKEIKTIDEMVKEIDFAINKQEEVKLTLQRNQRKIKTTLQLDVDNNGVYRTGLYVKDKITGIGTITYIDPANNVYGALGHEIVESFSGSKVDIKDGKIFASVITGISKTTKDKTGEKEASLDKEKVFGSINKNTRNGIYGKYAVKYDQKQLVEVASKDKVKLGEASIYTVLDGSTKEEFKINIIGIDMNAKTKNILFEITDNKLIDKTNGVIKGMSGSPIVQDGKIVGAVTHAIQNKRAMGYGIFITTMLEEGDK